MHYKALVNSIGASLLRTDHSVIPNHEQLQNLECSSDEKHGAADSGRETEAGTESDNSAIAPSSSEALDGRLVVHLNEIDSCL